MTYSIGFRAPSATELLSDLATELLSQNTATNARVYRDPTLTRAMAKGTIDERFIDEVRNLLLQQLDDKEQLAKWFARFMTTRKYPDLELDADLDDEAAEDCPSFEELKGDTVLCRHPSSRFAALAGEPATLAADGELYPCTQAFATTLADSRRFKVAELGVLDNREQALLGTLLHNGSIVLNSSDTP